MGWLDPSEFSIIETYEQWFARQPEWVKAKASVPLGVRHGDPAWRLKMGREWLALKLAPWLKRW